MSCVSVQEGYARWAPTYDQDPNPLLALEERHLQPLLPRLSGERVLDLASGTGRWSARLLAQGAGSVVGVDFSRAMLAAANRKPNLRGRLAVADCCDLPFRNGAFDLVLCTFALGHIRDVQRVAHEVARVTVQSADVYVSDLHPCAHAQGWKTAFRDQQGPVEIASWPRSLAEQLAVWVSAGFHCAQSIAGRLEEWELPILARAGKAHRIEEVRNVPAIQIFHFKPLSRYRATEKRERNDEQLERTL